MAQWKVWGKFGPIFFEGDTENILFFYFLKEMLIVASE